MCDNYKYIYDVNNILKDNNITTNICYLEKGFKQKMNYANRMNNKYVIIIGEDEVNNKEVTLKNMIDGSQQKIDLNNLKNIKDYID